MTHYWRLGIVTRCRLSKLGFLKLGRIGRCTRRKIWSRLAEGRAAKGTTASLRRRRALLAFVCALGAVQGRPYACGQCPAAFARRPYLDIHMRTHTGERPYQCDACLKRFTQKSSLNIHKRTHTGG